jgi:formylglycine-generating enzyme required for sulfatase activity
MSGNVWEWTDTCSGAIPPATAATAFCDAMGGAFDSTETELECVGERNWARNAGAANIGIRCCLDL